MLWSQQRTEQLVGADPVPGGTGVGVGCRLVEIVAGSGGSNREGGNRDYPGDHQSGNGSHVAGVAPRPREGPVRGGTDPQPGGVAAAVATRWAQR
jgi:hypothetical protein